MLKLTDNPPILYPEGIKLEEIDKKWWVAHTKSRNEKALAWALSKWDIPYFLPLTEKTRRRNRRVYKTLLPLFSGYLFFSGTEDDRYRALTTNRIANIIKVTDQDRFVTELVPIYKALFSGAAIDPHPNLHKGDKCRVTGGPLAGCEGILIRKKNVTRILLQIDILGQGAAVEIDADLLEQI